MKEEVDLTPETALRLARYFGTSPEFWLNLQNAYALRRAHTMLDEELKLIEPRTGQLARS